MAVYNKLFNNLSQKVTGDSVSWGSLLLLVLGLSVIVLMMMMYSQG